MDHSPLQATSLAINIQWTHPTDQRTAFPLADTGQSRPPDTALHRFSALTRVADYALAPSCMNLPPLTLHVLAFLLTALCSLASTFLFHVLRFDLYDMARARQRSHNLKLPLRLRPFCFFLGSTTLYSDGPKRDHRRILNAHGWQPYLLYNAVAIPALDFDLSYDQTTICFTNCYPDITSTLHSSVEAELRL
jgi:hypothetical protein